MKIVIDPNNFSIDFDKIDSGNISQMWEALNTINISGVGYLLRPGASITYDESTGTLTVSCRDGSETLTKNELTLLWMNFFIVQTSAAMSHPSDDGHEMIFEAIKKRIEDRNARIEREQGEINYSKAIMRTYC
jgi:hypothetical protein